MRQVFFFQFTGTKIFFGDLSENQGKSFSVWSDDLFCLRALFKSEKKVNFVAKRPLVGDHSLDWKECLISGEKNFFLRSTWN